ncbi:MAG TPA: discoidin domain-containing protein [Vicinamibacterales bacterium]|nr:discoidin domain-containing protein [Vicinamibacterales bacterium]
MFGVVFAACGAPEALHSHGNTGAAGAGGGAGLNGSAGSTLGSAGSNPIDASTPGTAGDTTGNAGAGTAGVGTAGAGTAGVGTAGAGTAGAGMAGAGTAGAGTAGAGTAGAGTAGAGTAGAGTAGAGTAGAGTAGAGTAGAGTAGAPGTAGASPGEYVNYCSPVHWTFSAPTAINANDFLTNVVDDVIGDRWSTGTNQVPGQYLQIDFGGTVSLTQVILDASNNAGDYPRGYDIGLSANGTSFTSVGTGAPTAAVVTVNFGAAQGRYLRINQTATANVWWSINELHLACTVPGVNADGGLVDPYDPTYWSATASITGNAGLVASNAIDPDPTSRWSTGVDQAPGESFTVDMGGVVMISGVTLDDGGAADFPIAYTLSLSTNGTTYTQVAMGAGAAGINKIAFTRQNARFFRVTQTGTGTNWWSIYGISVQP